MEYSIGETVYSVGHSGYMEEYTIIGEIKYKILALLIKLNMFVNE